MSALTERVLVLNRTWSPITTTSVRRAVTLLYRDVARVIDPVSFNPVQFDQWVQSFESWSEAVEFSRNAVRCMRGHGWIMEVPEVIVLGRYAGARRRHRAPSRRNLFVRDRNTCQYCGRNARSVDLTLDHVVPRARGGQCTWENLVVACQRCNQKKGCRTPDEAGLELLRTPERPRNLSLELPNRQIPSSWETFLGELYWNQELQE